MASLFRPSLFKSRYFIKACAKFKRKQSYCKIIRKLVDFTPHFFSFFKILKIILCFLNEIQPIRKKLSEGL